MTSTTGLPDEGNWKLLLEEATILLEVIVEGHPEMEIPYGDFAKKYRAALSQDAEREGR
jgi:hypothetical protein